MTVALVVAGVIFVLGWIVFVGAVVDGAKALQSMAWSLQARESREAAWLADAPAAEPKPKGKS